MDHVRVSFDYSVPSPCGISLFDLADEKCIVNLAMNCFNCFLFVVSRYYYFFFVDMR